MNNILIYTTPTCHFCHMAKEYFKSKGIKYEEVDLAKNPERGQEVIQKSGQFGVPVIEINGKIVIGFDRPKIDEYLK
ncbi:MAG: hypothetical protein UW43_C0004G0019 [Candidatus Yanofskybacteria bacterium GW2011_GWA1_44_21]|uniref:NrdH-redoxin n=1 Tax=Candidatus Yanofskybacteria bacterium RIFCSPLOWO2_02_FULL_44_18 TaxID=1802705 RepID=A0A1F8GZ94_9BACT|nr:MAG: hypothetical protein UW14_C0005G0006 [Candidatus Yanofskybacteria bacterium GW2011_GWA2_44_10]KKT50587.1 MAG: hypothetical protein UW43_C0004G0019 [Candidatus Yanofskybacteria bacterium GW2011_GWA1_44_21]OGN02767.1 MAG: NrdH-redoxin [Candidatus Yanofskybacteria bacterium RIFCSPHIGHO2_01_FULL_44_110b]OGN14640.1 MAG: NrdH-redoxin [Candidatus Yanofskybacteria bacterium RIFCSPHIGHO2_02_FULL_44_36b]OGN18710.1 MAG: NrdH-redoxin [Candidatus Yanofskybacteria bacterium RIFCSPHIGHO2_12_FULL_44_29